MKIAFVVNAFPSLSETFILNQMTGLADMGHEITIFARYNPREGKIHPEVEKYNLIERVHYSYSEPKNKTIRRLKTIGVILANFFKRPLKTLRIVRTVFSEKGEFSYKLLFFAFSIFQRRFDIIFCHFGMNGNLGAVLKKVDPEIKLVTMFHGYGVRLAKEQGPGLYHELFERGDKFLANSNYIRREIINLGADPDKSIVHPETLDCAKFLHSGCESEVKENGEITIISVARLAEVKGVEYGIRAFAALVKEHPDWILRYRIVGGGPLETSLRRLAEELSVTELVTFCGFLEQSEVILNLKKADIFLFTSLSEALGVALMEAQLLELPIVTTDVGGISQAVLPDKSAFLVPAKDIDAMVQKLEYLIENRDTWNSMGRCGREYVEKTFDVKVLNPKLARIFEEMLQ